MTVSMVNLLTPGPPADLELENKILREKVRILEEEMSILEERLSHIKNALTPVRRTPIEWYLTKQEEILLSFLVHNSRPVNKDMVNLVLYNGKGEHRDEKILDVFIHKLRRRFEEAGESDRIVITTLWGRGYIMEPDSQVYVKSILSKLNPETDIE